ncbi:ArsA family ATPase [bacterium]|nr:ArsA family ATPase [Planctomycetota bacterium]MBU1517970.1 ArsA family ATPase [Planctomycetota bacterium]MBU2461765.1 ArsA family ATPase [bacterium]
MGLKGLKESSLKLILFGGKGGVGKTTCASAAALYLAEDFKTLIFSTDPAHSLADSLEQKLDDKPREVKGVKNLSALEVNAEKALWKFKTEHEGEIKKIVETGTNLDAEDIDSAFALPIPGMDEIMGFKAIIDQIDEAKFDKYIVDTAPTGHALRLLTSPKLLDDWVKVMAKMRWKYRYVVETFAGKYNPDEGDDFLLSMKKTIKKIEDLLRDQKRCEFIAVTIPEDMAILETQRLINSLARYGIKVRQLIVNNVLCSNGCEFCREKRKEQDRYINQIKDQFNGLKATIVSSCPHEIKGLKALADFNKQLFS